MIKVWAGVDTGKAHHHCVVIDQGRRLLSRRVANDEPEPEALITEVTALGEVVTWAADMADGGAALLIGLLAVRVSGYCTCRATRSLVPGAGTGASARPAC
jgi:hypothetical protein